MHQSLTLAKKESNKYDLTIAPWFLLAIHNDWSKWFATSIMLATNHLDNLLWLADHKQGAIIKSCLLYSSLVGTQLCSTFYYPQHRGWTHVLHDELDLLLSEKYIVIVDYVFCSCDVLNSWLFLVNVRIWGVHLLPSDPIFYLFFLGNK